MFTYGGAPDFYPILHPYPYFAFSYTVSSPFGSSIGRFGTPIMLFKIHHNIYSRYHALTSNLTSHYNYPSGCTSSHWHLRESLVDRDS